MVQKIRRLMGRVDMRVLCLLLLGGLVGSLAFAAVQLTREQSEDFDARTINTWAQLTKEFTDFRESSYPLVIPAMLPDDSAIDWAALQNDDSEWYWDFDCGTYYFDPGSEISKQIPHDTELMVYEDIATEELLVLSVPKTLGAPYKEEMVFRASAWPQPSRFERYQRYIDRELNKRRIVWHVTMKSRRQAEREAALTASQPVMALDEGGGSMQMMSMESVTELKITNIRKATNGVELTISYPSSGYSGSVWSVYSYDAPACAYTNESGGGGGGGIPPPPDDTNEITEITGSCCEIDFSKRFQGLDNVWTLAKSNLVLSGVSNTLWLDVRPMAVDTNGEPCNRFLGLGNNGINPDNDGLSSASELYIHKTNPALADTDGDGASDGAEVRFGTNPLNNPGDTDGDGLSDDLEICIGTSISSQDTDLDWFGDAYEYGIGASPTNANEKPVLRMVINNLARFASHTNLAVGFPGTVAEAVAIAESNDLSGTLSRPLSTNCAYSLISETNGSRPLYARLYRNTIEQSPLIEGHIVFDNVSPSFGSLDPTNCAVTDRRWVKLAGLATDNLSRAHVLIDGQWADGIVNDEFVYDRYKLTAGTNLVALAAVDEAGNVATQQLAIVLDASGDTHAPIASLSLPRDYQIVDGQTNWFDTTTFGSNKILYVYGSVDDETADVHIQVHSGVQSSEVFEAVVDSNILWAAIEVYPGTNSLILTAADAAGNATTSSYCVVRDTNITLEIISPSAYQVINATNVTVVVRALPGFSSGSISVNGIGVAGGFFGIFSTTKKVPLNTQLTSLIVTATRNGRSYYADPPPIGYEILSYHREEVVHSHSYPCGSEPMNEYWTDTYEVRNWDAVSLRDATVKTGTLSHILIGGSLETFPVYQQSSRAQSLPVCDVRLGELTSFTLHDDLEGGLLATDEHLEYGSAVTFTKHAANEETQLVVFQFQDLSCNLDTPSDPSQITFRQARGFWYHDDVAFIVPMRTKIAQTITERDFTWPAHHRTFCNTGFDHEYCAIFEHDDHYLTFEGFHNSQILVNINEPDGLPVQPVKKPDTRFRESGPWCFEWQYVHPDKVVVPYSQTIEGLVQPLGHPFGYHWTVSAGTLSGDDTATPTFDASSIPLPTTMETVLLQLRAVDDINTALKTNRTLEVYRDHLQRDYENFGTGIRCGDLDMSAKWQFSRYGTTIKMPQTWNCFGSVWHAFDGTHNGQATDVPSAGFSVSTYTHPINWSSALAGLKRGDVVVFYHNDELQHAHTCMGSINQMYGANNQPLFNIITMGSGSSFQGHFTGTWRWALTSSQQYYEKLNADYAGFFINQTEPFLNKIKVYSHP